MLHKLIKAVTMRAEEKVCMTSQFMLANTRKRATALGGAADLKHSQIKVL